jgi:Mrp family chromosome partitioning ATPase
MLARLFSGAEPVRIIGVTSVDPGEGVSWTAARMAAEIERTMGVRAGVVTSEQMLARMESRPRVAGIVPVPVGRGNLSSLHMDFDVLVVDAGSLAENGSIIGLSRMGVIDAVVLVIEAGRTQKHSVRRALDDIASGTGIVAACVLNKRRFAFPAWLEALIG